MITRDMTIADILVRYPQTIAVFREFGLSCQECQIADFEEIEHGAGVHNINVDLLLRELNKAIGL
jgi:hybrid cluster-associated redox disulfide protein